MVLLRIYRRIAEKCQDVFIFWPNDVSMKSSSAVFLENCASYLCAVLAACTMLIIVSTLTFQELSTVTTGKMTFLSSSFLIKDRLSV